MKVIKVNYGLASNYGDFIEVNYKLNDSLKEKILKHERRHSPDRHYSKQDFMNDFQSENSYFFESLKFALLNPECLVGFFPLMYSYYFKEWTWNTAAMIPFAYFSILFTLVCSGFSWFFFRTNFLIGLLVAFIVYTCLISLMNLVLILYTHFKVKKENWFVYKEVLD